MSITLDQARAYLRLLSLHPTEAFSSSPFSTANPPAWLSTIQHTVLEPLFSLLATDTDSQSARRRRDTNPQSIPFMPSSVQPPDLVTAIITLTFLYFTLKFANYIRRLVFGWVSFIVKALLVYFVVVIAWSAYARGTEATIREIGAVWGIAEGVGRWVLGKLGERIGDEARARGYGVGGAFGGGRQQVPVTRARGRWN